MAVAPRGAFHAEDCPRARIFTSRRRESSAYPSPKTPRVHTMRSSGPAEEGHRRNSSQLLRGPSSLSLAPRGELGNNQTMNVYDLDRMGWQQFETLVQALAIAELGNGVRVFGAGRDGGREATFRGTLTFPKAGGEPWSGYGVIQAKHLERPSSTTAGWKGFLQHVEKELKKWELKVGTLSLERRPQYFLFATNAALTGTEESGGIDQFEKLLKSYQRKLGLKGWYAWDYNQISVLLDNHRSIRSRYLEQIVTGDFLSKLEDLLAPEPASAGIALAIQASKDLSSKQWVRIGDSGYDPGEKLPLSAIGIDLPIALKNKSGSDSPSRSKRLGAASFVMGHGDQAFRPSDSGAKGVVLIGGPGQGKSTLSQLIAHSYRVQFLESAPENAFTPKARAARVALQDRLRVAGFPTPERRRFPLTINLAELGAHLSKEPSSTLLEFMAARLSSDGTPLTPRQLLSWFSVWPICLVLDGLDEVPNAPARNSVIDVISDFLHDASKANADVFVLATTRPQGYRGEFGEVVEMTELDLVPLNEAEALGYSDLIISARGEEDPEVRHRVRERMKVAVQSRLTRHLMSSPLQVTIMTALAERAVDLPTTRYELFDAYYATIYTRELSKPEATKELKQLRSHIDHLHQRAGLLLHRQSETAQGSEARLLDKSVRRLLSKRLRSAGFDEDESREFVAKLLRIAKDRLVLLVSPTGTEWGFEVRSIQEFMAARAMTDGSDNDVLRRLSATAGLSHWRNVWLLAAGRVFLTREHLVNDLLKLVTDLNLAEPLKSQTLPGALLSLDLYNDEISSDFPAIRASLLRSGLALAADSVDQLPSALYTALSGAKDEGPGYRAILHEELFSAASTNRSSIAAHTILPYRYQKDGFGPIAKRLHSAGLSYVLPEKRDAETRFFLLVNHVEKRRASTPELLELIEALKELDARSSIASPSPRGDTGPDVWDAATSSLYDLAARGQLARLLPLLSQTAPDVSQFVIDLMRRADQSQRSPAWIED